MCAASREACILVLLRVNGGILFNCVAAANSVSVRYNVHVEEGVFCVDNGTGVSSDNFAWKILTRNTIDCRRIFNFYYHRTHQA